MLWEPKLLCVDTEIHPVTIFYSVSKLQLDGCLFFIYDTWPLVFLAWVQLYPVWGVLDPQVVLAQYLPSTVVYSTVLAQYFQLTFILVAVAMSPPPSKKSWVLRLQKKTWIFQYCTRRRPLDQVFAKVCKSLNEVACLTFSSLILFHAKIPPVNIDSREEMWKNLNRRRISFLRRVTPGLWQTVAGTWITFALARPSPSPHIHKHTMHTFKTSNCFFVEELR